MTFTREQVLLSRAGYKIRVLKLAANLTGRCVDMNRKFITIGEIMLRLTPPHYDKIRMASSFEASYGGSEANIALALANLGIDSTFFTVVPDNSLGKSAVRMLRSNDVHCSPVILSTPEQTPTHRLGTYYLETGYGIRPSKVIYDRKFSAITEYDFSEFDIDGLLEGFDWLHMSGITPALSKSCADFTMSCIRKAKEKGLIVSFDGNFRSTLWTWDEAHACHMLMFCLGSNRIIYGKTNLITPRAITKTIFRYSQVTSSKTRFSRFWSNAIRT